MYSDFGMLRSNFKSQPNAASEIRCEFPALIVYCRGGRIVFHRIDFIYLFKAQASGDGDGGGTADNTQQSIHRKYQ